MSKKTEPASTTSKRASTTAPVGGVWRCTEAIAIPLALNSSV
ncbi:hypothetical protein ACFPRL_09180 [Pseudoclavibacter helvolus]